MQLNQIAGMAIEHLLARMIRRALIAFVFTICALAALYQFTVAGRMALEVPYGALDARLIIGAIYAAVAVIVLAAMWIQKYAKSAANPGKVMALPHAQQIVMLVEAVMLGYELARKRDTVSRRGDNS